jgi:hypothetical protein
MKKLTETRMRLPHCPGCAAEINKLKAERDALRVLLKKIHDVFWQDDAEIIIVNDGIEATNFSYPMDNTIPKLVVEIKQALGEEEA